MNIDWRVGLFNYQIEGVEFLVNKKTDGGNAGEFDDMGLGKAQPLDAKILTPEGWKCMGDIVVGEEVVGSDGKPTKVLGIFPQGKKEVFKILFNDGSSTECCDDHLWSVNSPVRRGRGNPYQTKPLSAIRGKLRDAANNRTVCIPMVVPIAFSHKNLPIDPYVLGVLLGDGGIKYCVNFTTADEELADFVAKGVPEGFQVKKLNQKYAYRITTPPGQPNQIRRHLKFLGLLGKGSDDKFIPQKYLVASIEQRISLLQGLLDTDGFISKEGVIQFSSNSLMLANGVAEIVMSLGGNARKSQKISASGKNHHIVTICMPGDITPFRIERKVNRYFPRKKYKPIRLFEKIESAGYKETQCISVAAKDNLYVTDDFILTHNTIQAIRAADALSFRKILVVAPAIARINWQREFESWQLMLRNIFIMRSAKSKIPDDVEVFIVSYNLFVDKKFRESIKHLKFDVLILDEAHMAKNRKAARTQAIYGERLDGSGIVSQVGRTWILTGTPMPNNAGELYTHLRTLAPERIRVEDGRLTYVQFLNRFCIVEYQQFGSITREIIRGNRNVQELRSRLNGFYIRRKKEDVLKDLPPLQWGTVVLEPSRHFLTNIHKEEETEEARQLRLVVTAAAAQKAGDDVLADKLLSLLDKNKTALSRLRRLIGLAKVDPVVELIESEEDSHRKPIIFAYHKEVIAQLAEKLKKYNPVVITGDTSSKVRQNAIDGFQNNPEVGVFIGQISATNSAITLTASDNVLLVEPSWTPAENVQAAARAHRIGQKSSCVFARYVVLAGSLDETIVQVLIRKSKRISEIML